MVGTARRDVSSHARTPAHACRLRLTCMTWHHMQAATDHKLDKQSAKEVQTFVEQQMQIQKVRSMQHSWICTRTCTSRTISQQGRARQNSGSAGYHRCLQAWCRCMARAGRSRVLRQERRALALLSLAPDAPPLSRSRSLALALSLSRPCSRSRALLPLALSLSLRALVFRVRGSSSSACLRPTQKWCMP